MDLSAEPNIGDEPELILSMPLKDGNDHDGGPEVSGEGDNEKKKKKTRSSSKSGKKRRSSSTKGRRKVAADDSGENATSSSSKARRQSNDKGKKRRDTSRRNSIKRSSSLVSMSSKEGEPSGNNASNRSLDVDIDAILEQRASNRPSSNRSLSKASNHSLSKASNHSLKKASNHSLNRTSNRSLNRTTSSDSLNRPSSHRSLNRPSANHSWDRAPSNHSLHSSSKSLNLSFTSLNDVTQNEGKKKKKEKYDFVSDIDDDLDTKNSIENIPLFIDKEVQNAEATSVPTPSNGKDSAANGQRSREGKKNGRDQDPKHKKSRRPQLSKTDELGRTSNHYKLDGVYYHQKTESKEKKSTGNEPEDDEEEVQVVTKAPTESNGKDTANRPSTKGRFRTRRRGSVQADEVPRTRSKSRGRTRSKSREKQKPRAQKDYARMRSARNADPLSSRSAHNKNGDKRIKRGTGANVISPESEEAVKKLFGSGAPLSAGNQKVTESKNTGSESRPPSTLSVQDAKEKSAARIENTVSESQPSSTSSLNDNTERTEDLNDQDTTENRDKPRRRSRSGKPSKKDRGLTRITNKSGHKLRKKSTHEKTMRGKDSLALEGNPQNDSSQNNDSDLKVTADGTEPSDSSPAEEFAPGNEKVVNTEKTRKKDKGPTRRKSVVKERKSRGRDNANDEAKNPSPQEYEFDYRSKDTDSHVTPSLDSDESESEEKDNEITQDNNYLQLSFGAENNNLFALMDEKANQSFSETKGAGGQPETEDRNETLRSYISFADEVDLRVTTHSFNVSKSAHASGSDPSFADSFFSYDDDGFANDIDDGFGAKKTPTSKKNKALPFSLSKSLHHEVGRHHDEVFANDNDNEDSPRRKRRDSMLKKMKTGITEGGRRTLQKASSTRNMLEQATTRVLARRTEEGRGLLRNDSFDSDES